jgi:hypothetical protein
MLAVKRDGSVIELSDQHEIVKRRRNMILVIDHGRAFEIFNDCKKRKEILDAYLAKQPKEPEQVTIRPQPEESQQQADDSAQQTLESLESLANDPVATPPAVPVPVEDIDQAQQDEWHPDSRDVYTATIKTQVMNKRCVILFLSDGQTVFVNINSFSRSPGAHVCRHYAPPGTPVLVRLEETETGLRALEATIEGEWPHYGEEEEVTITHWTAGKNVGSGTRDCGCPIFILGGYGDPPFSRGDRIRGMFYERQGNAALKDPAKI